MAGRPKKNTTSVSKAISTKPVDSTIIQNNQPNPLKEEVKTEKREYSKKAQIPLDYEIPVRSNVQGGLVYVSRKTGYEIQWGQINDIEYVEYGELVAMRNAHRKFFEENWVLFDDTDDYTAEQIYYNLGVSKYYSFVDILNNLDDIFDLPNEKISEIIPKLSSGYKRTVASRAKALIKENDTRLDSSSKVKLLEKTLGFNLIDDI